MPNPTPPRIDLGAHLAGLKRARSRIVMITAYDYPAARIVDDAGVDVVLVGDSAATTVLGYQSTREVSIEEMLMLTRAVRRGLTRVPMVGDLPYGSYESSDALAVESASAFVRAGCDAVKLEGAGPMTNRVRAIVRAGIAVVGHVGLAPQQVATPNGYRARGRDAKGAAAIVADAVALEEAGCIAVVVEAVPEPVAAAIVRRVSVPVIGIGAGSSTDGQVLVLHDLLGLIAAPRAKFVKVYGDLASAMHDAVARFAGEVRRGEYPGPEHRYPMSDAEQSAFVRLLDERG
jgi:3-methyl-2-oxobutanoate hydroxymethyltransferase